MNDAEVLEFVTNDAFDHDSVSLDGVSLFDELVADFVSMIADIEWDEVTGVWERARWVP